MRIFHPYVLAKYSQIGLHTYNRTYNIRLSPRQKMALSPSVITPPYVRAQDGISEAVSLYVRTAISAGTSIPAYTVHLASRQRPWIEMSRSKGSASGWRQWKISRDLRWFKHLKLTEMVSIRFRVVKWMSWNGGEFIKHDGHKRNHKATIAWGEFSPTKLIN